MSDISCTFITYITASAEELWKALTDAESTAAFWGHSNVSDWQVGSEWQHIKADGSGQVDCVGEVLESKQPRRLAVTFPAIAESVFSFDIEEFGEITRLTLVHSNLPNEETAEVITRVWPAILSNLKTLLESGSVMPTHPTEFINQ